MTWQSRTIGQSEQLSPGVRGLAIGPQRGLPRPRGAPRWIMPLDDPAAWTVGGGTGVISADAANWLTAAGTPQSVKLAANGTSVSTRMLHTPAAALNMAGCRVRLRFYVHAGTGGADPTRIKYIQLRIWSTSSAVGYAYYKIWDPEAISGVYHGPGWYQTEATIPLPSAGDGAINYSAIVGMWLMHANTSAADTVAITYDALEFWPIVPAAQNKPVVCITLDDANSRQHQLAAYAAAKGVPLTHFISPSLLGTGGKLTLDQCVLFRQLLGNLVANHGWAHAYWFETVNLADYLRGAEWLAANGFSDGARIFAVPGGTARLLSLDIMKDWSGKYWNLLRGTYTGQGVRALSYPESSNLVYTPSFDSRADALTALNNLIAACGGTGATSGRAAIFPSWHVLDDAALADAKLFIDDAVMAVAAGDVLVGTVRDWLFGV